MQNSFDLKKITEVGQSWAHLLALPLEKFKNYLNEAAAIEGVKICGLHGESFPTERDFMEVLQKVFQLPGYFGKNWNAFEECIHDLDWLPAKSYIIFITNTDRLFCKDTQAFDNFVDIMKEAAGDWMTSKENHPYFPRPAIPFHVLFHAEPENETIARERLKKIGVSL